MRPRLLDPVTHEDPSYARGWNDALAALDVNVLAKAAQDHETSGIHGALHCSLACGVTLAAEYARLIGARPLTPQDIWPELDGGMPPLSELFGSEQ